jgi:glycerophosphoryl diester phosphodiesterase
MATTVAVIAHRGASGLTGEDNTLRSFGAAVDLGCDYVEFDVRRLRDGLVAFHDGRVGDTPVAEFTLAELRRRTGVTVPTLAEVLDFCRGRIGLDVEIKDAGIEDDVVAALRTVASAAPLLVKSFNRTVVARVAQMKPGYPVGLLVGPPPAAAPGSPPHPPAGELLRAALADVAALGADFLSPHHSLLADEAASRSLLPEMSTYVWTVNDPAAMARLVTLPIRGLITDRPDLLLPLVRR